MVNKQTNYSSEKKKNFSDLFTPEKYFRDILIEPKMEETFSEVGIKRSHAKNGPRLRPSSLPPLTLSPRLPLMSSPIGQAGLSLAEGPATWSLHGAEILNPPVYKNPWSTQKYPVNFFFFGTGLEKASNFYRSMVVFGEAKHIKLFVNSLINHLRADKECQYEIPWEIFKGQKTVFLQYKIRKPKVDANLLIICVFTAEARSVFPANQCKLLEILKASGINCVSICSVTSQLNDTERENAAKKAEMIAKALDKFGIKARNLFLSDKLYEMSKIQIPDSVEGIQECVNARLKMSTENGGENNSIFDSFLAQMTKNRWVVVDYQSKAITKETNRLKYPISPTLFQLSEEKRKLSIGSKRAQSGMKKKNDSIHGRIIDELVYVFQKRSEDKIVQKERITDFLAAIRDIYQSYFPKNEGFCDFITKLITRSQTQPSTIELGITEIPKWAADMKENRKKTMKVFTNLNLDPTNEHASVRSSFSPTEHERFQENM